MKVGLSVFPTNYSMNAVELAKSAEARSFDALWVVEHTHIPASRRTPYPMGGELPSIYWEAYEPFTFLAQVAAVTTNLKIGTGVCLAAQHHPLALAKRVATLDALSNGRFLFGVGAGWLGEEMENHGFPYEQRWSRLREHILAMQACWTEKEAQYHGEYVDFDPVWVEPKPVSTPHPPVYIGATSTWAMARIAEYAQGWYPVHVPQFDTRLELLGQECAKRGRSIDEIDIALLTMPTSQEQIAQLQEKGVNQIVLSLPTENSDSCNRVMDDYGEILQWAKDLE